jgi:hypothetical protein
MSKLTWALWFSRCSDTEEMVFLAGWGLGEFAVLINFA